MCGRYFFTKPDEIYGRYRVTDKQRLKMEPNYNVAPGQELPLILEDTKGRHVRTARWGLVPSWAKDPAIGYRMINARVETLAEKPSYRKPLVSQRAIVPASGFYEWKNDGKEKTPYAIKDKKEDIISLAGLYDVWEAPDGTKIPTFTIITTDADETMRQIHDRMPVVLSKKGESHWLDPEQRSPDVLESILKHDRLKDIAVYEVSLDVNSPKNNNASLILPV